MRDCARKLDSDLNFDQDVTELIGIAMHKSRFRFGLRCQCTCFTFFWRMADFLNNHIKIHVTSLCVSMMHLCKLNW